MFTKEEEKYWRDGYYLATAENSGEADILESKLNSEGIPVIRRYSGAGNAVEIIMGSNSTFAIDLYVPEETIEDARNIILPYPLSTDEMPE
jgi:hypothetical protein